MSTSIAGTVTVEELLAMPEDGMDREVIRGQLKERPMTYRNRFHARVVARISFLLTQWQERSTPGQGQIHAGEAGCILRRDPDTIVGIDVAYFSAEVMDRQSEETTLVEGPPKLAVEVLSPSDKTEGVRDKVLEYLSAGVQLVWVVDPYFHTVTVHRPDAPPEMFNDQQMLSGAEVLPSLEIPVVEMFS